MHGFPTIWKLFGDFFETIFNLDNRVYHTLSALIVPGRLTNNYLSGQRKKYLNPLRIFFVSAVIMVAMATILTANLIQEDLEDSVRTNQERGFQVVFSEALNEAMDSVLLDFPHAAEAFDTLGNRFQVNNKDSLGVGYLVYNGGVSFTGKLFTFSFSEVVVKTPKELVKEAGVTNWFERFQITQLIRLQNLGTQGVTALMGQLVWGLLFLIPLYALMLKLLYIRRSRWFVEHFVFSLHTHTFFFLAVTLTILAYYLFNDTVGGFWLILAAVPLYFIGALKTVYRQSWIKTLLKAFLLLIGYLFIVINCLAISVVISIILF